MACAFGCSVVGAFGALLCSTAMGEALAGRMMQEPTAALYGIGWGWMAVYAAVQGRCTATLVGAH